MSYRETVPNAVSPRKAPIPSPVCGSGWGLAGACEVQTVCKLRWAHTPAAHRSRARHENRYDLRLKRNSAQEEMTNHMSKRFQLKVILASLANLLALSYIVYLTGYNFLFFVFFFVPVSLCGWYLGRLSVVSMAILSGVSWCIVDILSNHQYPCEVFRYANSLICFLAFAIIGLLLQRLRHSLNEQLRVRHELEKALEEINRSTEELRKLQSQLQVVCAWTKRINVEGRWVALDEFLTNKLNTRISYGVSPEAMQEVLQTVEQAEAPAVP